MRVLRLCLGLVLAAIVLGMWQRREPVIEAYTDERPPVQFEFDGLDFEISQRADLGPSPLVIPLAPDTTAVALTPLQVTDETISVSMPAGDVSFAGTVSDVVGPVPFATVRVEYHRVSSSEDAPVVASLDVVSDENGNWELRGVGGGRFRIRAFVPDLAASSVPVVRFVPAGETVVLDLTVSNPDPSLIVAVASPSSRYIDESAMVAVTAGRRRVDANGIVIVEPLAGARVEMVLGASVLSPVSSLTSATDGSGVARFGVTCGAIGSTQATFVVEFGPDDAASVSSGLTTCVPPPPPEEPESTDATSMPGEERVDG